MTLLRAPEFAPLLNYLEAQRTETLEALSEAGDENYQGLQGEARVLKRLIESIQNSEQLLAKLQQHRQQ